MSLLQALLGSMSDSYGIYPSVQRHHSMGNLMDDPYAEEAYKASLKQWLADNAKADIQADSAKLGEYANSISSQLDNPNLNQSQKDTYLQAMGMMRGNWETEQGLAAAMHAAQQLLNYTGQAGVPTNEMKNFQAVQANPQMEAFLNSRDRPASIQIAQMLSDPTVPEELKQNLRYAHKMEKDPSNIEAVAAAGTRGKEQTESVIEAFNKAPAAFTQYERIYNGFENTKELINKAREKLAENPGAAGWTMLLQDIPETDAKYIKNLLGAIKANVSLDTLTNLKNTSPSGASGFGALSEGELKVISELLGSLDQMQSAGQVIDTLNNIEQRLGTVVSGASNSLAKDREWFENNKHYAPDLYTRFKGSFELLQPTAPRENAAPQVPQAAPAQSMQDTFNNNMGVVSGRLTPQQEAEAELRRRGLLPGGMR